MWLFHRKLICSLMCLRTFVLGAGASGSICWLSSISICQSLLWVESDDVSICFML